MRSAVFALAVSSLVLAGGAVSADEPAEADVISTLSLSCKKPYALTQDCSGFSGAKLKVTIEGFDAKIAGSADGKVVMVMDAHLLKNSFRDFASLTSPTHSEAARDGYEAVRRALEKAGIPVVRVRPLRSLGNLDGYVLELGADGYGVLKAFAKK